MFWHAEVYWGTVNPYAQGRSLCMSSTSFISSLCELWSTNHALKSTIESPHYHFKASALLFTCVYPSYYSFLSVDRRQHMLQPVPEPHFPSLGKFHFNRQNHNNKQIAVAVCWATVIQPETLIGNPCKPSAARRRKKAWQVGKWLVEVVSSHYEVVCQRRGLEIRHRLLGNHKL